MCVIRIQDMGLGLADHHEGLNTSQANGSRACFLQQLSTVLMGSRQGTVMISILNKSSRRDLRSESLATKWSNFTLTQSWNLETLISLDQHFTIKALNGKSQETTAFQKQLHNTVSGIEINIWRNHLLSHKELAQAQGFMVNPHQGTQLEIVRTLRVYWPVGTHLLIELSYQLRLKTQQEQGVPVWLPWERGAQGIITHLFLRQIILY